MTSALANEPDPAVADARRSVVVWSGALAATFVVLHVLHVWIVDDAFITLRQVDQLLAGNGFVWNQGERVQAYTHPLWALLLVPVFALTGEGFWTLAIWSIVVSLTGLWWGARALGRSGEPWRAPAFLLMLIPSKAFFDFTSSGLENCLTHGLVVATWAATWTLVDDARSAPFDRRRLTGVFALAAATYLNRADTVLLVLPAALVAAHRAWPVLRRGVFPCAAIAFLPVILWTAWTVFYYGAAVPNTAVAKITGARLTANECVQAGLLYALDSLLRDPWTLVLISAAMLVLLLRRTAVAAAAALAIGLYLGYVTLLGAAGTHMGGRFYSGPACLAAFALARALPASLASNVRLLAIAAFATLLVPASPARSVWQPSAYPFALLDINQVIDTRSCTNAEGAGIFSVKRGQAMPAHDWFRAGLAARSSPERVHVGGFGDRGADAIGFAGFAAGRDKFLIDCLGLSDALIARLPMARSESLFRHGHVKRTLPAGYVETVRSGENRIEDPDLRAYYEKVHLVVSGPLWSWERLTTIVAWNCGSYDHLLNAYAARHGLRTP